MKDFFFSIFIGSILGFVITAALLGAFGDLGVRGVFNVSP